MKWVKRIGLAVAALVVVVLVVVYIYLNSILRTVVQQQASASLTVPTTLGSADLSIFGGKVSLGDLEVGSPPSFSAPHLLTCGGVAVEVSYGQLTGTPIHIKHITLDGPIVVVEQANLKLNIQALMDQMPQTPQDSSGKPTTSMKLIIDQLDLDNAQVVFMPGLPGMNNLVQVPIPSVTLTNIGNADGNGNGVAIKDVVMQVVTAMVAKGGDVGKLPAQLTQFLSTNLGNISQQLGGAFDKQFQNVAGSLGNIGSNAGGEVNNAAKTAGSAANDAGKSAGNTVNNALNGLFGGGNKKQGQ